MSCILHLLWRYNPQTATWSCSCGARTETDIERANHEVPR